MRDDVISILNAEPQAKALQAILIDAFGIDGDTLLREQNGTASLNDNAVLTVTRCLFNDITIDKISTTIKIKALVWIRRQKIGRQIQEILDSKIKVTRYTYETKTADESVRHLLNAYKKAKIILYATPTEVLYDNNIAE